MSRARHALCLPWRIGIKCSRDLGREGKSGLLVWPPSLRARRCVPPLRALGRCEALGSVFFYSLGLFSVTHAVSWLGIMLLLLLTHATTDTSRDLFLTAGSRDLRVCAAQCSMYGSTTGRRAAPPYHEFGMAASSSVASSMAEATATGQALSPQSRQSMQQYDVVGSPLSLRDWVVITQAPGYDGVVAKYSGRHTSAFGEYAKVTILRKHSSTRVPERLCTELTTVPVSWLRAVLPHEQQRLALVRSSPRTLNATEMADLGLSPVGSTSDAVVPYGSWERRRTQYPCVSHAVAEARIEELNESLSRTSLDPATVRLAVCLLWPRPPAMCSHCLITLGVSHVPRSNRYTQIDRISGEHDNWPRVRPSPRMLVFDEPDGNESSAGAPVAEGERLAFMQPQLVVGSLAPATGESRMLQWLASKPRVWWEGGRSDARLLRLFDGAPLEVQPGTGISTGEPILLKYVPREYQCAFWERFLDARREEEYGLWEGHKNNSKNGRMQNYTVSLTRSDVLDPANPVMITMRREAEGPATSTDPTCIVPRCFASIVRGVVKGAQLGVSIFFFRYTPNHEYPQMVSGDECFCPMTMTGNLHENLPFSHFDRLLRNDRSPEGYALEGGQKVVLLRPMPQLASPLAVHAIHMSGHGRGGAATRYTFRKLPEDGSYTRSAGSSRYQIMQPLVPLADGAAGGAASVTSTSEAASASAPFIGRAASQHHQAILLAVDKPAAGCGEVGVVWDAPPGFPEDEWTAHQEEDRRQHFPEAASDNPRIPIASPLMPPRLAPPPPPPNAGCGETRGVRQRSRMQQTTGGIESNLRQQELTNKWLDGRLPMHVQDGQKQLTLMAEAALDKDHPDPELNQTIAFWEEGFVSLERTAPDELALFQQEWKMRPSARALSIGGVRPAPALAPPTPQPSQRTAASSPASPTPRPRPHPSPCPSLPSHRGY